LGDIVAVTGNKHKGMTGAEGTDFGRRGVGHENRVSKARLKSVL